MATNSAVVGILRTLLTMDTASYEAGARKAEQTNVKLSKSTSDLGKEIGKITPQAEKMVKSLGGDKLLYTANSLTQAITKLGGAHTLTERQQASANRTLTDAIAKYTALGQKAPAAMLDLERATRKTIPAASSLTSVLSGLGPVIAASFSLGAVVRFARSMGAFASEMQNLATETDVGVERLQAFNYIAAGADLSITDITTALTNLADRLGSGDTSATKRIERLGLSLADIKRQRPDEVLFSIAKGFERITDQNERIAIIRDLFGARTGTRMLRLFEGDLKALVEQVERTGPVISKELIDKAAEFDKAWDQAVISVKANLVRLGADITNVGQDIETGQAKAIKMQAEEWRQMMESTFRSVPRPPGLAMPGGLPKVGASASEVAQIEKQSAALLKAAQAAEAYRLAVERIWRDISGNDAVEAVRQLGDAWGRLTPAQQANSVIVQDVLKRYEALRKEVGSNVVPALEKLFVTTGTLTNQTTALRDAALALTPAITAAADSIEGRLLPSGQGIEAMFELSARLREAREEAERFGGIAPQITEENERVSESVERQASAWAELGEQLRSSMSGLSEAAIGNLGGLLFGFGHDNREAKREADEAEQDYLRIKRSGKATAEELTLAFKRFHEATERANHGFAERFKDVWQGIKSAIQNILNEILQFFAQKFLVGLVKGMAGAKMGGLLGNILGGGASAGAGALMSGGAAAGTTALAMSAATPAIAAGTASAGGAAAGGAAAGGGLGATLTGLATNPITWGVAAGVALTWAIAKKGLFRGGWEGIEGNKRRNQFWMGNFGGQNGGDAMMRGAAALTGWTGQPGGGIPWQMMQRADSKDEFERAQANIIAIGAQHGKRLKAFSLGGFIPPGVTQPAMLHGGGMGEIVLPLQKLMQAQQSSSKGGGNTFVFAPSIHAWDGRDVTRAVREQIWPEFRTMVLNNIDGVTTTIDQSTRLFQKVRA